MSSLPAHSWPDDAPFFSWGGTDEQLGKELLAWGIAILAAECGITLQHPSPSLGLSLEFRELAIVILSSADTPLAHTAIIEKALRRAAAGEWETAGKILRCRYQERLGRATLRRAVLHLAPDAELGQKRREQQRKFARAKGQELKAERKPEWERWRAEAARLIKLNPHLGLPGKKSELARKVKKALSLSDSERVIRLRIE